MDKPLVSDLVVNDAGDPEEIYPDVDCTELVVVDDTAATSFRYRAPDKTSAGAVHQAGAPLKFEAGTLGFFAKGRRLGWIETVSPGGTVTFKKIHK